MRFLWIEISVGKVLLKPTLPGHSKALINNPLVLYIISWDPNTRMTPEESLQHEWIKEGLVHKRKEQHGSKHHKHHAPATADSEKSTDPYKVPAQPVKGIKITIFPLTILTLSI